MKLPIALGVVLAALTVVGASAQSNSRHVFISHSGGSDIDIDANEDGWITRAEASSAYERIFADLDTNDDGRLNDADRRQIHIRGEAPDVHVSRHGGGERDVRVITGDLDEETQARIEREVEEAVSRAEVQIERAERESERAERHTRHLRSDDDGERHVVIIRTNGDGGEWTSLEGGDFDMVAPVPPVPPVPPIAPFMLLIANSEEADLNGDGALSLEEFRNQHLRFFDASDANGDGRVRFEEPPAPPQPPAPPAPPEPPRRR